MILKEISIHIFEMCDQKCALIDLDLPEMMNVRTTGGLIKLFNYNQTQNVACCERYG